MRLATLFLLRLSVALLLVVWGADKIVNPAHGAGVADRFYFGILSAQSLMPALGIAEIALGALVGLGVLRRITLPIVALVTGMTLVGVWRSVLDPLGLYLGRTNILFFPSLIIFCAVLVLMAFRVDDRWALQPRG